MACFIVVFIVNGRDYKNETSKKEFIIGNSVSSVVGAVILFAIIFVQADFYWILSMMPNSMRK